MKQYYSYFNAPPDFDPKSGSLEWAYLYFTKYNDCFHRVEFDGETFTCYVKSAKEFKRLESKGFIHDTYDTYQGKVYRVVHRVSDPSQKG